MAKFQLRLNVEITQCDEHGHPVYGNNRLQVVEDIGFHADSFLDIARVLGEFHHLGTAIKEETTQRAFEQALQNDRPQPGN